MYHARGRCDAILQVENYKSAVDNRNTVNKIWFINVQLRVKKQQLLFIFDASKQTFFLLSYQHYKMSVVEF